MIPPAKINTRGRGVFFFSSELFQKTTIQTQLDRRAGARRELEQCTTGRSGGSRLKKMKRFVFWHFASAAGWAVCTAALTKNGTLISTMVADNEDEAAMKVANRMSSS